MMKLREIRHHKGWSLSQLGKESDLNLTSIWAIETGKATPHFGTVRKICDALEILPNEVSEFLAVKMPYLNVADPKYPEAVMIIKEACDRLDTTFEDICDQAKLHPNHPPQWFRGDHKPKRESLEALADALGTPELMDAIPFWTDSYLLTCTGCGRQVTRLAHKISEAHKGPYHSSYVVDNKTGTGTYLCNNCFDNPVMKKRWENRVKSVGKKRATAHMKWVAGHRDPNWPRESIKLAHVVNRGNHQSDAHKEARAASIRQPLPAYREPTLCLICSALHLPGYQRRRNQPRVHARVHAPCWSWWRSKDKKKVTAYPEPIDPLYSTEDLANMWKLTWRHVVLGENIRNKNGTGLAKDYGLGKTFAFSWVHFILDHLPTVHRPPWAESDMDWLYGRGGAWLTKRCEILSARAIEMGLLTPVDSKSP